MGKAVQGSALYHACPADIQRTSVSCTVNLSVIMSSIMHRQQQEQQQRRRQNNPQKTKGHRLSWWRDSQLELCIERWGAVLSMCPLRAWTSLYPQTNVPLEPTGEPRGETAGLGPKSQATIKLGGVVGFCAFFAFCVYFLQIQIDRQTNPRADFKNQPRHKINYFDGTQIFFPLQMVHIKSKLFKAYIGKIGGHVSVGPKLCHKYLHCLP